MNHLLFHAITNLSDDLIDEAITTQLRRKYHWERYATLAACLALVILFGRNLPSMGSDSTSTSSGVTTESAMVTTTTESATAEDALVHTTQQAQTLVVTLVAWQDEGFRGVVNQGDSCDLFPEGAQLTVILEAETEILLDDGTSFIYSPDAPNAGDIAWPVDTLVNVSFTTYEAYQADNGFYNRLYATHIAPE